MQARRTAVERENMFMKEVQHFLLCGLGGFWISQVEETLGIEVVCRVGGEGGGCTFDFCNRSPAQLSVQLETLGENARQE